MRNAENTIGRRISATYADDSNHALTSAKISSPCQELRDLQFNTPSYKVRSFPSKSSLSDLQEYCRSSLHRLPSLQFCLQ